MPFSDDQVVTVLMMTEIAIDQRETIIIFALPEQRLRKR